MIKSNFNDVKNEYDGLSTNYDLYWERYLLKCYNVALKLSHLKGNTKKKEIILDVSGGTGLFASKLLQKLGKNIKITIVDLSEGMLKIAKRRFSLQKNIKIIHANVHHLPFKKETFTTLFSISAFHYYNHPCKALYEIQRILKKDGTFVLLDWCNDSLHFKIYDIFMRLFSRAHHKTYTSKKLVDLLENSNFKVEEMIKFKIGWWSMVGIKSVKI